MRKTLRFWAWINGGPVKLAMQPGESIEWTEGGPCDEGYSYTYERLAYDSDDAPGLLLSETTTNALDCDGRRDTSQTSVTDSHHLAEIPDAEGFTDHDGRRIMYPQWRERRSSQRDYSAEAAGY